MRMSLEVWGEGELEVTLEPQAYKAMRLQEVTGHKPTGEEEPAKETEEK